MSKSLIFSLFCNWVLSKSTSEFWKIQTNCLGIQVCIWRTIEVSKVASKERHFHRSLLTKKKSTLPIFLTKWRVYYLKTGKIKNSSLTWYSFPVWKISDISITKILREIKFVDSNLSILTFLKLFTWWRLKFTKSTNFRPRITKNSSLRASTFSKSWFHVKSKWQKNPKISTLW